MTQISVTDPAKGAASVASSDANAALAENRDRLSRLFAWIVVAAGLYVVGRGALSLLA